MLMFVMLLLKKTFENTNTKRNTNASTSSSKAKYSNHIDNNAFLNEFSRFAIPQMPSNLPSLMYFLAAS